MVIDLKRELQTFEDFAKAQSNFFEVVVCGPSILKLVPKVKSTKMTLGFMALTHGNESIGIPILNELISSLLNGKQVVDYEVYFALGNIPAALADKRFLEEDLNRSFGLQTDSWEAKRARELQSAMLDHCDYLIDLHQTVSPAKEPFFIFQYASEKCLDIIHKLNPGIPTILQYDQIGFNTGLSSDEYLRQKGKFGTALELGQKGTTQYYELGLSICQNALDVLVPVRKIKKETEFKFPIYKLDGRFTATDSSFRLSEGWENLKGFKKGEIIGESARGPVRAPETGFMLFPRYRAVEANQELFYYCTPLNSTTSQEEILEAAAIN